MKIGKVKLSWDGIEGEWYYFYWWNWLPKKCGCPQEVCSGKSLRYWGYEDMYYDGPHHSFGFWFFNVSWRLPWF